MNNADLPTVSVIIPCFNYGRFVACAVQSALRQTHRPLEVIVVNDGSSDDTERALQPFMQQIIYIPQKNQGVSAARNTGIRAARGQWVAMLDADDLWHEHKLRFQMQCAREHPEACLVGALLKGSRRVFPHGAAQLCSLLSTRDLLSGMPFGTSSAVAKRDALEAAGLFNENRRYAEDREMWLKLSLIGRVARVNAPLWEYRRHGEQAMSNTRRMAEGYRSMLDEFFALNASQRRQRPLAYGYFFYDTAMSHFEGGERWNALRHLLCSFAVAPVPLSGVHAEIRFSRAALLLKCAFGNHIFGKLRDTGWQLMRTISAGRS